MLMWTKQQAKDFLVNYHFINSKPAESLAAVFDRLQVIQMDPLNIIGLNPDLVLQSRLPKHNAKNLYNALYKTRYLIDAWDKQMSIYKTEDYPKLAPLRTYRAQLQLDGLRKYTGIEAMDHVEEVMEIITEKGPIFSREIAIGEAEHFYWGPMKPSTATIDYLFHKGLIGIHSRQNTQKKYDLIERLIPDHCQDYHFPSEEAFIDWFLLRRIRAAGLVWNRGNILFLNLHIKSKKTRSVSLERLIESGLITPVTVEGVTETLYVPTDALDIPIKIQDKISFLAPLDNMTWERDLIKELFDFDYKWEVYVPAAKRQYGYYVLPMIQGSDFIGRIEFDKHRKKDPLVVKQMWFEDGVSQSKTRMKLLSTALSEFATYLGASDVRT